MDGARVDYLHWTFHGQHVLLPGIALDSLPSFFLGAFLAILICFSERMLTFALERRWTPSLFCSSRSQALWRTSLYGLVSFLRLDYMLIAMSFHFGLILIIVFSLASAQLLIELCGSHQPHPRNQPQNQPLLAGGNGLNGVGKSRSKSKPDSIFIHPNHSNLARADAVALELGLSTDEHRESRQHDFQLEDDDSETD